MTGPGGAGGHSGTVGPSAISGVRSADAATWKLEAGGYGLPGGAGKLGQVLCLSQHSDDRVFAVHLATSSLGVTSAVTLSERASSGNWASVYSITPSNCSAEGGYPACLTPHSLVEAADGTLWFTTAQALVAQAAAGSPWESRLTATNLAFWGMGRAADETLWLTGADAYAQGNGKQPREWVGRWNGTTWTTPVPAPLSDSAVSLADIVLTDQGPLAVLSTSKPNPKATLERLDNSQWVPICQFAIASTPALVTSCPGKGLFAVGTSGPVRIELP